ncbi:MAG: hypothetical protein LBF58_12190 [Deltaproteobacteria bacterium]|jgi:hypothetical protein|nr:hypothetical protein [Deltaproteobacteria bacterium]
MPDDPFTTDGAAAGDAEGLTGATTAADKEGLNPNGDAWVYDFTSLHANISILLYEHRKLSPHPVGGPSGQRSPYRDSAFLAALKNLHRWKNSGDFIFSIDFENAMVIKIRKSDPDQVVIYDYARMTVLK